MLDFQSDCGLTIVKGLVKDEPFYKIYGFILYTRSQPEVVQVLRDSAYWNALDEISGLKWPIFAVRPLQERSYPFGNGNSNSMQMMLAISDEPRANATILNDFGLANSKDLPLFVAFMWDNDDQLHEVAIPIRGDDMKTVYHSLAEIVTVITEVVKNFPNVDKNTLVEFQSVEKALKRLNLKHSIIERGRIPAKIAEFLLSIVL